MKYWLETLNHRLIAEFKQITPFFHIFQYFHISYRIKISCFSFEFSGIFAYLNYLTPKTRKEVLDLLVTGLKRLEYRGYDSAGLAIDSNDGRDIVLVKRSGKVQVLEDAIKQGKRNYTILIGLMMILT